MCPSLAVRICKYQIKYFSNISSGTSLENQIHNSLSRNLEPTKLVVKDTSGGCGAMFDIFVESPQFKGMSLVGQHKLVTKIIGSEIKQIHGLTLKTMPSL